MDLKELDLVDPNTHWYYQSKSRAIRQYVTRNASPPLSIVEVGAGSGFFACALADFSAGDSAICVDPFYEEERTELGGRLQFKRTATESDVAESNVLLFIDVLEHVERDDELLASYIQQARPGTLVVITVPAFMSMWSAHDVYLEHYRRYRLGEVVDLATRSGLTLIADQYLFGSIFPIAWVVRRMRRDRPPATDLRPQRSLVNSSLAKVLDVEHGTRVNRLAGTSALVVARV